MFLVADFDRLPVLLEQLRVELGRLRSGEPREQVPVLLGHERFDRALAVAHQLQRDRLHASGAQAAADLVPEQRAELVADQTIEHAPRALGGDHLDVDGARMVQRLLHRLPGDLVERQAMELPLLARKLLRNVPADGLAFAVGVGRDVDVRRVLGGVLQFLDDLLARDERFVLLLEIVVDVDTQLALGEIADVSHRRDDFIIAPEILVDRLRLGGRFDHDQCFSHVALFPP